jgi:hypothetical protein
MIEAECRITAQDYVRAQYLHLRPKMWVGCAGIGLLAIFALVVVSKTVTLLREGGTPVPVLVMLGLGGYLAGYFLWYLPWRARRLYAQQKALLAPFRMRVTEEGVFAESEHGQALLPWGHVRKWKENRRLFLLYHSDVLFQAIPKRYLKSEAEAEELRGLLRSHVKDAA